LGAESTGDYNEENPGGDETVNHLWSERCDKGSEKSHVKNSMSSVRMLGGTKGSGKKMGGWKNGKTRENILWWREGSGRSTLTLNKFHLHRRKRDL